MDIATGMSPRGKKSFRNACECGNYEFIVFARANGSTSYNQLLNKKLICSAVRLGFLKRLNGEWIKFYHRGYGGLIAGMTVG